MFLSSAPASAADVANPDLKLCPPYFVGSKPARKAYFLIMSETDLSEISKIFPILILLKLIQSLSFITGQNSKFSK